MNILLASKVHHEAVLEMRRDHHVACAWEDGVGTLDELVRDAEILVFRSGVQITAKLMASAPNLRLLIRAGSGLDNLDLDYVQRRGLELQRIPEPGARAVAELAIGLMVALARQVLPADMGLRKGRWLKQEIEGYLLQNKTLGIVGSGNIGTTVGVLARAIGMDVVACVECPDRSRVQQLAEKGIQLTDFKSVLQHSDFLSLHVPLKDSTRHLLSQQEFSEMKSGAYLVNLARGGVVNEEALYHALIADYGLAGAALDVHALEGEGQVSPLAALHNVILTPHIGAATVDTQRQIGRRIMALVATKNESLKPAENTPGRCDDGYQDKTA